MMSIKDKLEIGLKPDAPYRPDNLPEHKQDDPSCAVAAEPGDGPEQEDARDDCNAPPPTTPKNPPYKESR